MVQSALCNSSSHSQRAGTVSGYRLNHHIVCIILVLGAYHAHGDTQSRWTAEQESMLQQALEMRCVLELTRGTDFLCTASSGYCFSDTHDVHPRS